MPSGLSITHLIPSPATERKQQIGSIQPCRCTRGRDVIAARDGNVDVRGKVVISAAYGGPGVDGLVAVVTADVGLVSAQSGYRETWWTVDGGGAHLSGASGDTLLGTARQPGAGPSLASASYTLTGGYWSGAPALPPEGEYTVFLPLVVRWVERSIPAIGKARVPDPGG
jgi:hypothetical protein